MRPKLIPANRKLRYISLVAAACMVLYGYDASVYNSVQGSDNWVRYFEDHGPNTIGAVNTAYTVGAISGGFFLGGLSADILGRKMGMAIGCVLIMRLYFHAGLVPSAQHWMFHCRTNHYWCWPGHCAECAPFPEDVWVSADAPSSIWSYLYW